MPDKKIHIQGIPYEITLRRNTRIKRLSIKITTHSGVVVCIPFFVSESRAIHFLENQKEWMLHHMQTTKYQKQKIPNQIVLANSKVFFQETEHNISKIKRTTSTTIVRIPKSLSFEQKEQLKRKQLEKVLRIEATKFLPERVGELADIHGFKYKKVSLRNQKTRWGSCSFHNHISLNIQLMRLPLRVIDYVIIHELCHTVHKNHSTQFWKLVYEKMGEKVYSCKKELRTERIQL